MKISLNSPGKNEHTDYSYGIGGYKLTFRDKSDFINTSYAELPVATALLLAMFNGDDIETEHPLTLGEGFNDSLCNVQNVIHQWNPKLRKIGITSEIGKREKDNSIVAASFSGGVDSLYTFLTNKNRISHLLFMRQFEPKSTVEESEAAEQRLAHFSKEFGKELVAVDYGARKFSEDASISWRFLLGPVLAGIALSSKCSAFLISSSFNYRMLKPWGSHPLLDPLWSTNDTKIEHIGLEATRVQKTAAIASDPDVYKYLQVCWSSNSSNCGKCSKCVRTGITLHLLGAAEGPVPLKGIEEKAKEWPIVEDGAAEHIFHLMHLARDTGNNRIARMFERKLASFVRRQALHDAGRELLGKRLTQLLRPRQDWHSAKVLLTDPSKFRD